MIRRFCDQCTKELTQSAAHKPIVRCIGAFKVEIRVAHNNTWNSGDICESCVIDIVNSPTAEAPPDAD